MPWCEAVLERGILLLALTIQKGRETKRQCPDLANSSASLLAIIATGCTLCILACNTTATLCIVPIPQSVLTLTCFCDGDPVLPCVTYPVRVWELASINVANLVPTELTHVGVWPASIASYAGRQPIGFRVHVTTGYHSFRTLNPASSNPNRGSKAIVRKKRPTYGNR